MICWMNWKTLFEQAMLIDRAHDHDTRLSPTGKLVRGSGGSDGHVYMESIHGKCSA
jgi:hypothetical protein